MKSKDDARRTDEIAAENAEEANEGASETTAESKAAKSAAAKSAGEKIESAKNKIAAAASARVKALPHWIGVLLGYEKAGSADQGARRRGALADFGEISLSGKAGRLPAALQKSFLRRGFSWLSRLFACTPAKVYGAFFLAFGAATILPRLMEYSLVGTLRDLPAAPIAGGVAVLLSIPLLLSVLPFSQLLQKYEWTDRLVFEIFCFPRVRRTENDRALPTWLGALFGALFGALGYLLPLIPVLSGLAAAVLLFLAAASPEFSLLLTILLLPAFPLMGQSEIVLTVLTGLTLISYVLKVLIGKRVFRVSAYEIVLFLALPLLLIDGIAHGSVGAAAVAGIPLLSLLLANELTVNRRIADSASELLLFSSIPTASYGVIRYALDRAAGRTAEKFASCFFTDFGARTGYIRAVSTFGDPDAFAAFLLVTILLALVDLSDKGRSRASRAAAALVLLLNATAFVLTFSHGAWLALLLCAAVRPIYRSEKPVKFLSLPLMFLPAAVYLLPAGAVSDFLARAGLSAAPIERRRAAIADVLARLKNNLLLGEGDASFLADNATLSGATAPLFLQLILSVGLPITLLFLLFLVHRTHQLNRFRRYIRPSSMYAPALSASLALFALFAFGSCVYLFFDSTILYLFCVICGIGEAALRIGRTEAAERDFYGVENSEDAAVADIEIG